jgi:hypothetical protein
VRRISWKRLVELLVTDLNRTSLAALVLEEAEEGSGQDGEHDNVTWDMLEQGIHGLKLCRLPTRNETIPPARSTRPLKKLMIRSMISVANLAANFPVFSTRCTEVVKKDQTSSTSDETRSDRALMMEDMVSEICGSSLDVERSSCWQSQKVFVFTRIVCAFLSHSFIACVFCVV